MLGDNAAQQALPPDAAARPQDRADFESRTWLTAHLDLSGGAGEAQAFGGKALLPYQ